MNTARVEQQRYPEANEIHSRLIKCPLAVEESRAYWERAAPGGSPPNAQQAFEEYWFGAKSLDWVKVLILNFQVRFAAYPETYRILQNWQSMPPETRTVICHWHLQLTDPLYRAFSGDFLLSRREAVPPELHRSAVVAWVVENGKSSWTLATQKKMATRLLSVALSAGLISSRRDPRTLTFPRVSDDALAYVMHFLRVVDFRGTLLENPYLRSVGLEGPVLEARLRKMPEVNFQRIGDVVEFDWRYPCLGAWAEAELPHVGLES
jgi:hypothetical protein